MLLNTTFSIIIALCGIFILPLVLFLTIKNERLLKRLAIVLLIVYISIMLIGVWTKILTTKSGIKISLDYSYGWLNKDIRWGISGLKVTDALINLVMLVPIGMVFALFNNSGILVQIFKSLGIGLVIGFIIEFGQFVLPVERAVQTTDVLLNGISMAFGCIEGRFYAFLRSKIYNNHK